MAHLPFPYPETGHALCEPREHSANSSQACVTLGEAEAERLGISDGVRLRSWFGRPDSLEGLVKDCQMPTVCMCIPVEGEISGESWRRLVTERGKGQRMMNLGRD